MFLQQKDIDKINNLAVKREPFLFVIDYEGNNTSAFTPEQALSENIFFEIPGFSNNEYTPTNLNEWHFDPIPLSFQEYEKSFTKAREELLYGNSFLLNLTFPVPVSTHLSLEQIFTNSKSLYKLLYKDEFVVFSPEAFIKIKYGCICSYPMKGTIDASVKNAASTILADKKEHAEHATIVDLIRNDLSRVAKNVTVTRFRYITEIESNRKKLLQVSSEIKGELTYIYPDQLGNILSELLPAGSITGAPKQKTCEIIKAVETDARGFYTGVFGYFDGENLDSAVMIRFIENKNGKLIYRSGGGITIYSEAEKEYNELIDKVYVPVIRNHTNI